MLDPHDSFHEPATPAPEKAPVRPSTPTVIRRSPARTPRPARSLDRLFLNRRGELTWDQMASFRGGSFRQGHRLIFWSWLALAIDGLILLSLSCVFLMTFALIVRSPVGEILRAGSRLGTGPLFAASFAASAWLYLIFSRVFFGFSIGEWACDLRLGQPTQRARADYPVKVVLRASLILASGFITFPVLSLLGGRDLAGELVGLKIISLK